jgi:hypothetical protein
VPDKVTQLWTNHSYIAVTAIIFLRPSHISFIDGSNIALLFAAMT